MLERDRQLGRIELQVGREHGRQLLEILRHVAVVVERVDEQGDDALVAIRALQQIDLPEQMLAQRGRVGGELRVLAVFAVVMAAVAAAAVLAPFRLRLGRVVATALVFSSRTWA